MRRYVIATFNRNHHVRMEKRKEKERKKMYKIPFGGRKLAGPHRNDEITIIVRSPRLRVFSKSIYPDRCKLCTSVYATL